MQGMVSNQKKPLSQEYLDSARRRIKIHVGKAIEDYNRAISSAMYEKDNKMALAIMEEAYPLITRRAHNLAQNGLNKAQPYYAMAASLADNIVKLAEQTGRDENEKEYFKKEAKYYYRIAAFATNECAVSLYDQSVDQSIPSNPFMQRKRKTQALRLWEDAVGYAKKSGADCDKLLSDIQIAYKMASLLRSEEKDATDKKSDRSDEFQNRDMFNEKTNKSVKISDAEKGAKDLFNNQFYRAAIEKYKEAAELSHALGNDEKSALLFKLAISCSVSAAEVFQSMSRYDIAMEYLMIGRDTAAQIHDEELLNYMETKLASSCTIGLAIAISNISKYSATGMQSAAAIEAENGIKMLEILHQYKKVGNYDSKFKDLSYGAAAATAKTAFEDFWYNRLEHAKKGFDGAEKHAVNSGNQKLINEIHKMQKIIKEKMSEAEQSNLPRNETQQ